MSIHASHRVTRHLSALFVLSGLVACGTLPADEFGDRYPVSGDDSPGHDTEASPEGLPIEARWPGDVTGIEQPDACAQLACGGQSCTDGICNALLWRAQLFGAYDGELGGVAFTPEGDVIMAGSFAGTMETPDGSVDSIGGRDVFVAKMAWSGELMWLKRFGGEGSQHASSVAVSKDGEIAIGGELEGAIDAGEFVLQSAALEDGFVLVLDENGKPRWGRRFGDPVGDDGSLESSEHQTVASVAFLADGDVVVGGSFYGILDLDEEWPSADGQDAFVAHVRSGGDVRWARSFAGPGDANVAGVRVHDDGRIFATGSFSGVLQMGSSISAAGAEAGFAAALGVDGSPIWLRSITAEGGVRAEDLALGDDALFVTGTFVNGLSFGGDDSVITAGEGGGDGFVARLDAETGFFDSVRAFGDDKHQHPTAVSVGPAGDVAVVGWFTGAIDVGLGTMTADQEDAFVAVYGEDGPSATWSHRYGPGAAQMARAVQHRSDGAVLMAGEFVRAIDLGWGQLGSNDLERKIFVAAVAP